MAAESEVILSHENDSITNSKNEITSDVERTGKRKERIYAAIFLGTFTGISALIGFGTSLAAARKQDPKSFGEGLVGVKGIHETGASLACRALGWGTFYAVTGCSIIFYSIWKISGATNMEEFRYKMGSLLPRIPKNDPPKSRTEFEGLTDLLTYISEDWGKKKALDHYGNYALKVVSSDFRGIKL